MGGCCFSPPPERMFHPSPRSCTATARSSPAVASRHLLWMHASPPIRFEMASVLSLEYFHSPATSFQACSSMRSMAIRLHDLLAKMMPRSLGVSKPFSFQMMWFLNLIAIWHCLSLGTHYFFPVHHLGRLSFALSLTQHGRRQRRAHFGIRISDLRTYPWQHGSDYHWIQFC